jgi:hypothetical protein
MRRLFSWPISILLLFAATAAAGQTPNLPPDHFINCEWNQVGVHPRIDAAELTLLTSCEAQLQAQKRNVLEVCLEPGAGAAPPRVIQACSESLDRDLLHFVRSVALGDLGNQAKAFNDLRTAIGLDPSLARYVVIRNKAVLLTLPPL